MSDNGNCEALPRKLSMIFFNVVKLDYFSRCERFSCVFILAVILLVLCPSGVFAESNRTVLGEEQTVAVHNALEGEWVCNIGNTKVRLILTDDNKFSLNEKEGSYLVEGAKLILKSDSSQAVYDFELDQNQLLLSGADLSRPLKFTKIVGIRGSQKWLSAFSIKSLQEKSYHLLSILVLVIVCRILLYLFKALIHFIIYSNKGPLRFIYRKHKSRTMTIYSLVTNIAKYIVYLFALGFALSELGVNYTAYFASLSVIGLAIGFGSQGLVQDMVTGFFIIFESQFNVGDMVEIPPHVGIVEELGLRMTRIRNYLGQTIIIPNRNIAAVGNFTKGAQQVQIDVAVKSKDVAEDAKKLLSQITNEISVQFAGTIVTAPKVLSESSLETGEHFVRVCLAIWPQQQWVVDQQILPRIREGFRLKGIEIPSDRVIAFYRPRKDDRLSRKN